MEHVRAALIFIVPFFVVAFVAYAIVVTLNLPGTGRLEAEVASAVEKIELGLIDTGTIAKETFLDKVYSVLGIK